MKRLMKRLVLITMIFICFVSTTYAAGPTDYEGDTFETATLIGFPTTQTRMLSGSMDGVDVFKFKPQYTGEVLLKIEADEKGVIAMLLNENYKEVSTVVEGKTYYIRVVNLGDYEGVIRYTFSIKPRVKYGDINEDGYIDSIDFALLRTKLISTVPSSYTFNEKAADVNGNGSIDSIDFALIRQYVIGQTSRFPAGVYIE